MTDLSNPHGVPSNREFLEDKQLEELGEEVVVTFTLKGKDALEFRRLALTNGMNHTNFGKFMALRLIAAQRRGGKYSII